MTAFFSLGRLNPGVMAVLTVATLHCGIFVYHVDGQVWNSAHESLPNDTKENLPEGDGNSSSARSADVNATAVPSILEGNNASGETSTKRTKPTKVTCRPKNTTNDELVVQMLNTTSHSNYFKTTPNATVADCALLLFYVPWCQFSASAAPHFNALPRLYPDIQCIAVNAELYSSLTTRYGTISLPTLYLFHNGHPVAKFNESYFTLENFVAFVKKNTGLDHIGVVNVTSADFVGPLPSTPIDVTDYYLWLSWIFVICCCCYGFTKSSVCHRMIESLRNNWHEAEAQHEHID